MGKKIKEVDAYIMQSADFAQPLLNHFRELVHKACPDVEEKIKWSFPHFDYKGTMMCSMAAFKQHCAISFWKAALMTDTKLIDKAKSEEAMGHLGKLTSLKDLPKDSVLVKYIKEGMKLNEGGVKLPSKTKKAVAETMAPDYFMNALKKNKKAQHTFDNFSNSNKREYILWVTEAKTEHKRSQRLASAIEWMSEGKPRNWKYLKK